MSVDLEPSPSVPADYYQYRALSSLAVASLIVGALSCLSLFDFSLAVIPFTGMVAGAWALRSIRNRDGELTGRRLAWSGIILSLLFWGVGWARLSYVLATEVPPGYERVSYDALQPDPQKREVFPQSALALEGKRIFIKGYAYPGRDNSGIKQFILVPDMGTCCFGTKTPKLTHMIQVKLKDPLELEWSLHQQRLAGTFHVRPAAATGGLGAVIYELDADHLD